MADQQAPHGSLARAELKAALELDRVMSSAAGGPEQAGKPSLRVLASLALAVGLPFIGFGFFDNFIMILAGEEIENQFGAKLGLSTLAAAGLGNLLSDICGLGLADQIEAQASRVVPATPLSALQQRMVRTRVAKVGGMTLGVSVGCLLGMVPCLWLEPHARAQPSPA
ncbi:hypothetical protein WJX81_008071 [Elliptochloris bilobata]|uniref:Transmembrane protein 65 n=1 Tax=Elliptochloris bilobata TaxID=381761 RepID=A0AAW1SBR1_9CHLO